MPVCCVCVAICEKSQAHPSLALLKITNGWPVPLSLHPAGAVAAGQFLDFVHTHLVKVAFDGVFERAGGHCEVDGFLRLKILKAGVDQAAAEAVAAADSIHNSHRIFFGEIICAAGVEHAGPVVVVGGDGFAERNCHFLEVESLSQFFCHLLVAHMADFAGGDVCVGGMDAENIGGVFLVVDAGLH